MINLHATSQASFREKRMVFQLDSSPGEAGSEREFQGMVADVMVPYNLMQNHSRIAAPAEFKPDASVFADPELDLATTETHAAATAFIPPAPIAPPKFATEPAEEPLELDTSAAPASIATPAQSKFIPEKPHQPSSFREPIAKQTATHAQPQKTGFFSRLMARITGPTKELNPATTKLRQPTALKERQSEETLPVYLYGSDAATNMPHTAKTRLHNTILFDDQSDKNAPSGLPLATRLENANSNDLFAYARAKFPTLKIGFDGKVDSMMPWHKIAFAKALAQNPELRACTEELQNRAANVRLATKEAPSSTRNRSRR